MPSGVYKKTEKHKRKISEALTGRKVPKDVREKISKNNAKYWLGKKRPSLGKKLSIVLKGKKFSENGKKNMRDSWTNERREQRAELTRQQDVERWKDLDERKRFSERMEQQWKNEKCIQKMLSNRNIPPSQLEKEFMLFIRDNNLPFKYVGNGKLIIDKKVPDFAESNGKKIVLEVAYKRDKDWRFGSWQKYEESRIQHFMKNGWKCLVLWSKELEDKQQLFKNIKEVLK